MTASTTETLPEQATTARLLQRQILPLGGDVDVLSLYVDAGPIALDADRYGANLSRKQQQMLDFALQQAT
ncbi:MAG TPA: hypothetical protein VD859_01055, partial [Nocardioides sp.]|nr:hypothetical protein [Nocardioides sp.]